MELNDDQFNRLRPYESYLATAIGCNFVRSLPMSDAVEIKKVYTELGLGSPNLSCGKCVLNICKRLGELYYIKKEQNEKAT